MKKILIILFLSVSVSFAQYTDWNAEQDTVHLNVSVNDSLLTVDMYTLFGAKGSEFSKPFLFQTDSAMTSTSVTVKIYNDRLGTYMTLEDSDGSALSWTIEANKTYRFDPTYFGGVRKFQMEFGSAEAADRVITIIGRVY